MLIGGVLLMIAGALIGFISISIGGGAAGVTLGLPGGAVVFAFGFLLAIAGAIVSAIHEHKTAVLAEIRGEREDLRIGFKSLWDELDRVRANTEPSAPVPVYEATPITSGDSALDRRPASAN